MRPLPFFNRQAAALVLVASGLTACGGGYDPELAPALAPDVTPELTQVTLTGEQEAPNLITTAAIGNATLSLNRSARTISATITIDGMVPTLAHIHAAEAGSAGPVVFPMTVSGSTATLAPTVVSTDQLATLDAGGFYFNVHSAENPAGEIRGQIGREVFVAQLTGSQENPPSTSTATGAGRLVLDPITRQVSGEIELQGIEATLAHVHTGAVGVNGPVLIGLLDHGGHGHFTVPEGTVMTAADVDKLHSGGLYFNAHSTVNPNGEIRGQIGRRILFASASGAQEVPAVATTATALGFIAYDAATRRVGGALSVDGFSPVAAHIHQAPDGANGPIIVNLAQATAGSSNWVTPTNAAALTVDQAKALLAEGTYFNAHSSDHPNGEIRGQLRAAR
jgi:hypothetical protein